jgi:hypothetical protein
MEFLLCTIDSFSHRGSRERERHSIAKAEAAAHREKNRDDEISHSGSSAFRQRHDIHSPQIQHDLTLINPGSRQKSSSETKL